MASSQPLLLGLCLLGFFLGSFVQVCSGQQAGGCPTGFAEVNGDCVAVDECTAMSGNPCHVFATCVNRNGSFACYCNDSFVGDGVSVCLALPTPSPTSSSTSHLTTSYILTICACAAVLLVIANLGFFCALRRPLTENHRKYTNWRFYHPELHIDGETIALRVDKYVNGERVQSEGLSRAYRFMGIKPTLSFTDIGSKEWKKKSMRGTHARSGKHDSGNSILYEATVEEPKEIDPDTSSMFHGLPQIEVPSYVDCNLSQDSRRTQASTLGRSTSSQLDVPGLTRHAGSFHQLRPPTEHSQHSRNMRHHSFGGDLPLNWRAPQHLPHQVAAESGSISSAGGLSVGSRPRLLSGSVSEEEAFNSFAGDLKVDDAEFSESYSCAYGLETALASSSGSSSSIGAVRV